MDRYYSSQVRREEALALRSRLGVFVDQHEQVLFDAQQRLHHASDATCWSRDRDVVTVQLADTPHHRSVEAAAHHQPRQRRAQQQCSMADVLGSGMAEADPHLFRCLVTLASLNAEMQALQDEGHRCYAGPLALVGDANENCYRPSASGEQEARPAGTDGRRGHGAAASATAGSSPSTHLAEQVAELADEERLLHATGALLPLLQELWRWRQRVQAVVAHFIFNVAVLYAARGSWRSAAAAASLPSPSQPLLTVRLTSCWDCLGALLGAVLAVEEVLQQNASIRDGVEVMQRLLAQQLLEAGREDAAAAAAEEEGELLRLLLQTLQADLLDSSLLASVASQPFDQLFRASWVAAEVAARTRERARSAPSPAAPPPLPFSEHTALCEEWTAVLTEQCADYDAALASPRAVEHKARVTAILGLAYLMRGVFHRPAPRGTAAGSTPAAASAVGKSVAAQLAQLSKRVVAWQTAVPLLPLHGLYVLCPLLWWRRAFAAELATAAGASLKDGAGALVRRTVTAACQAAGAPYVASVAQWADQVERWAGVDMQSALPIDAPHGRFFVQRTVLLVQRGVALARGIQDGTRQLLLLHHHAEAALTLPMVHGVLHAVLLLQRIAAAFHAKLGILASAQDAMVQSIVFVLEKHLHLLYTRACASAKQTAAGQEQPLALHGALHLLHSPLTTDTMTCLLLLLDAALNRETLQPGHVSTSATTVQERDDAFIALAQLRAVLGYQQAVPAATSAALLFFHRETLYPLFLQYCYTHPLAAASLPQVVSALADSTALVMTARHVPDAGSTLLRGYVEFVRDCLQHELVQPLCTEIENQLRLRTHDAVLGQPYRVLRPTAEAAGRDLTRYTLLPPFRFFGEWVHVAAQVEHHLSTQFYNLNALMPNDWRTYEEMRNLALRTFHLRVADGHLPSCILDQGLDVLVITENIQQFVAYYTYNLNEQVFIQRPALTPSKHLHTLNTRHIANSIRTHGTGVMNTAVNYVYKYLLRKMAVLSHFLHDDYVRSHLLRDARLVRQRRKEQQPIKYTVEQADQLVREMDRLGVAQDGVSFLEKARQLVSEMGNALGFMRMMRSGGLRAVAEGARFLPLPVTANTAPLSVHMSRRAVPTKRRVEEADEDEGDGEGDVGSDVEDEDGSDGDADAAGGEGGEGNESARQRLRRSAASAVEILDRIVQSMLQQLSDGSEYYPLLLDAIGRRLRRSSPERYAHLQLLYLLTPALANLHVAYTIREKEKLLKKHKDEGVFSDDGFAVGASFLLVLFGAYEPFDALHWFELKRTQYRERLEAVQLALSSATAAASPEFDSLHLTSATLQTLLHEYTGLQNAFSSSRLFFDAAAVPPAAADASPSANERRRHTQRAGDRGDDGDASA